MGSASSRMSASPALVDSATETPAADSAASAVTTESEGTSAATVLRTVQSASPARAVNKQSTLGTEPVSDSTRHALPIQSNLPLKIDKGKGKQIDMSDDKEEGEISEEEQGGHNSLGYETTRLQSVYQNSDRRRSSASARSVDSYRPASYSKPRPHQHTQLQHQQQQPPLGPRPHQPPSKSQSPNDPYLHQQWSQPRPHVQPQYDRRPHQHNKSRATADSTSSSDRPIQHAVNGQQGRVVSRPASSTSRTFPLTPPLPPTVQGRKTIPGSSTPAPITPPLPHEILQASPPEDSLAIPKSVTPEEANQYMDIIRNLMNEGIKPDVLIKRGATPKYVSMVCREIIESSRPTATTSLFTEIREPVARDTASPDDKHDIGSATKPSTIRSLSLDLVEMAREASASPTSSSDIDIKVERMLSPEQPTTTRLIPTSSWTPSRVVPPSPVRVGTYRPSQAGRSRTVVTPHSQSQPVTLPASISSLRPIIPIKTKANALPRPVSSYTPVGPKNTLRERTSELSPVVKRPVPHIENDIQSEVQVPPGLPPTPPLPPALLPNAVAGPGPSAMNALLESKRRALSSMQRGRKANSATPGAEAAPATPPIISRAMSPTLPEAPIAKLAAVVRGPSPSLPGAPATQATLEDEVAALEQEVIGLQNAKPQTMDIDEPEEGEISDIEVEEAPTRLATPTVVPKIPAIVPSKTPLQLNKSTKRRNAEEMMESRASIQARSIHPPKRRLFGAIRQKPIIIHLDDSDSSDSDEESHGPTAAEMEMERQRMLKEKEDNINRLREQILRLQAKAARDKRAKVKDAAAKVESEQAASDTAASGSNDVVMGAGQIGTPDHTSPSRPSVEEAALELQPTAVPMEASTSQGRNNKIEVDTQQQSIATPQLSTTSNAHANEGTAIDTPRFSSYRSIIDRYPDLITSSAIKRSLSQFRIPDRKLGTTAFDGQRLSSIILTRKMQREPNAVICGAEAAGGSCADPSCTDIHFGKDLQRPDDGSLVEYLSNILSSDKAETANTARLQELVMKAKEVLGLVNPSLSNHTGTETAKSKKVAKLPTTYDMSVAQRIVVAVCDMTQDDDLD